MTFTTTKLAGNRVLVKGEDQFGTRGQVVLDSTEWDGLKARQDHEDLHVKFDEAVEKFFAPLMGAIEQLDKAHAIQADPLFYVVTQEATKEVKGQHEELHFLSKDSVILRLLEQDANGDRLVWVNDELEILAAEDVPAPAPTVGFDGGEEVLEFAEGSEPTA